MTLAGRAFIFVLDRETSVARSLEATTIKRLARPFEKFAKLEAVIGIPSISFGWAAENGRLTGFRT
jgi:hypothetical protein